MRSCSDAVTIITVSSRGALLKEPHQMAKRYFHVDRRCLASGQRIILPEGTYQILSAMLPRKWKKRLKQSEQITRTSLIGRTAFSLLTMRSAPRVIGELTKIVFVRGRDR